VVATVVKPSSREYVGLDGCRRVRALDQPVGHTLPPEAIAHRGDLLDTSGHDHRAPSRDR
jgi:hypothetical protein